MKNRLIVVFIVSLITIPAIAKSNKAEKKNKKIIEKEEHHYQKELRKNPYSASTYWEHANKLAEIKSESYKAEDFYKTAIKIDSVNGLLYRDYGKYLFDRLHNIEEAKNILSKGSIYAGSDTEIKKYLVSINKIIDRRVHDENMKDFGKTDIRAIDANTNYASLTKFDSLKVILSDSTNANSYHNLLQRFLNDDKTLTPANMYMLLVGYSNQKSYNSFNYNDISELRMNSELDTAIYKGIGLIAVNPVNPSLYRELMYFYRLKNDPVMAEKYENRIHQIFNGMLYSGNGTCQRPYITLWPKEEYNFITYLGYKSTDTHSMGSCADQMSEIIETINPVTHAKEDIHFNMQLIYLQTMGK